MIGLVAVGDGHLHDRLDAPQRPRAEGAAAGRASRARSRAGSTWALVAMAFLAVLREGLETAVFLLAAFQDASDPTAAGAGAVLGLVVAVAIGVGLYRGGVRLDLARFFRVTGVVLVIVAAGLVATSLHTAAEAGWINGGQQQAFDLLADRARHGDRLAADRHARAAAAPDRARGHRLARSTPCRCSSSSLRPTACGRRCAPPRPGWPVVAAPVVLLVGVFAGGDAGGAAAASRPGAARSTCAPRTRAASPAVLRLAVRPGERSPSPAPASTRSSTAAGSSAEAENLAAGLEGDFSLTLQPGAYTLRCSGGRRRRAARSSTGARRAVAAAAASASYRRYLERETAVLVTRTHAFAGALRAGDVEQARALFASARSRTRRSSRSRRPSATSTRGSTRASTTSSRARRGRASTRSRRSCGCGDTTRGTAALADGLRGRHRARCRRCVQTVKLEPAQIANGATDLLGRGLEVQGHRRGGPLLAHRPERLRGQRRRRQAAFDAIRPALRKRDPSLAT